ARVGAWLVRVPWVLSDPRALKQRLLGIREHRALFRFGWLGQSEACPGCRGLGNRGTLRFAPATRFSYAESSPQHRGPGPEARARPEGPEQGDRGEGGA